MRVFSLNVWFEKHFFNRRCRAICALIRSNKPDVVCLQEVTPDFVLQLNNERNTGDAESHWLNDYLCSDPAFDGTTVAPYGVMMLVKNSLGVSQSSFEFTQLPTNMDRLLLSVEIPICVEENVLQGKKKGKNNNDNNNSSEAIADAAIDDATSSMQEQSPTTYSTIMESLYSVFNGTKKKLNTICVSTVHLESLSFPGTRALQLQDIHKYQNAYEYAIIAGDFNFDSYKNFKDMYCSTQYFTREERSVGVNGGDTPSTSSGSHGFRNNVGNNLLENDILAQVLPEYTDVWCHVHNIDNDAAIMELKENQFKRSPLHAEDSKYGYTFDEVTNIMVHKQRYAVNPSFSVGSDANGNNKSKAGALRVPKAPSRPSKKQARIDEDGEPLSAEPLALNRDQLTYFAEPQIPERMRYDRILLKSSHSTNSLEKNQEAMNDGDKNTMYLRADSIAVIGNEPISDLDEENTTSTTEKETEEDSGWDNGSATSTSKEGSNKENTEKNDGYSSPTPHSMNRHKNESKKGGIYSSPPRETAPVVFPSDHYGLLASFTLIN